MALPRVKINYLNGLLGTAPENQDGLLMLAVLGAASVSTTFALGTPYRIVRPEGLAALGVTADNNARLHELVRQFYAEAEEGTPLYVLGLAGTSMTDACDVESGSLKDVVVSLRGALRGIVLASASTGTPTVTEGLDPDVFTALPKAQALADYAAVSLYAPLFFILEGRAFSGASSLRDLSSSLPPCVTCPALRTIASASSSETSRHPARTQPSASSPAVSHPCPSSATSAA